MECKIVQEVVLPWSYLALLHLLLDDNIFSINFYCEPATLLLDDWLLFVYLLSRIFAFY